MIVYLGWYDASDKKLGLDDSVETPGEDSQWYYELASMHTVGDSSIWGKHGA